MKQVMTIVACLIAGMSVAASAMERQEPVSGPELEQKYNLAIPTLGGMQVWEDLRVLSGWRIQRHVVDGHYRLLDDANVRRAWGTLAACSQALDAAREAYHLAPRSDHAVVLVHGLGRTRAMFDTLTAALEAEGYEVVTVNYPSTARSITAHAEQIETVLGHLEGIGRVSFVTHSLGGIVMRKVLSRQGVWRQAREPYRLVMMGPPNQGSVFARQIPRELTSGLVGASLDELRVVKRRDFPAPTIEFGIIAGGRGQDGYNPLIPGNDDGVVAVHETHLSGASDFLVVEGLHSYLPSNSAALAATIRFLATGAFAKQVVGPAAFVAE